MNIKQWQKNSPAAFYTWLSDIKPKILHRNGQYKIFQPTQAQRIIIDHVLSSRNNIFNHSPSLVIQPRRHGKSTVFALICLWLFTSRRNFTIQILGNSEMHTRRVQFKTMRDVIRHTPILRQSIPEASIRQYDIQFSDLNNVIQISAQNISASFGDRINLLWVSDLHAAVDLAPFHALLASLLDSAHSICLVDSNVDFIDGPVHSLQKEAETDSTIYCSHLYYKDIEDYVARAPEWIDRSKGRRLQRILLPVDAARDLFGKRLDAKNALFPSNVIEMCKTAYKIPVSDLQSQAKGRTYKIGGGLDRSKSLFAGRTGDHTVWTTIMKVASPEHGEPEYYILNQQRISPNISRSIKKAILKDHERYKLDNCVLENYEVTDLAPWLTDQKIPFELVSAHDTTQNASFPEFHRISKEGRFHFSSDLKTLESELSTFSYTQRAGGKFSFGHSSKKHHDDTVYSTNWAIFSLRSAVMSLYSLGNIQCHHKSPKKHMCFLMGGNLQLFCSESCDAFLRVEEMFQNFKQYQFDSELNIREFYKLKVKRLGSRISQAI